MSWKEGVLCLLVVTFIGCYGSSSVKTTDYDVIDYICESYEIDYPDGFRIRKDLELLYYQYNVYYVFREYKIVDKFGKLKVYWVFRGGGYINIPRPSIADVQMEKVFVRLYLDRQKARLRKELLDGNQKGRF